MNYVIADKAKAIEAGFSPVLHKIAQNGKMILSEREVLTSPLLNGDIKERLESINGILISKNRLT